MASPDRARSASRPCPRGAAHATFLDSDAAAIKLIGENLRKLGETAAAKVIRADATRPPPQSRSCPRRLATSSSSIRPYKSGLATTALAALSQAGWIAPGAVATVEVGNSEDVLAPAGFEGDRRAALWGGQDRDPAAHAMTLTGLFICCVTARPPGTPSGRMQGTLNSDLTERGRAQARAMGRALKAELAREPVPTVFPAQPAWTHPRNLADRGPGAWHRRCAMGATIRDWPSSATARGKAFPGRRSRSTGRTRSLTGAPIRTASARPAARAMPISTAAARPRWPTSSRPTSAPSSWAMA
ncbi:MAG: RsmD family RNA methyltransferase [Hyphomicrobium sp.]